MRTFYLDPGKWREPYALDGAEARHLSRVLRAESGQEITLVDGQGRRGVFRITEISKARVLLDPVDIETLPRPASQAWLALGWNKAARRGWLLEKCVELHAGGVIFWEAERSQGRLPKQTKDSWRASLIAGAKQCSNPFLPELAVVPGGAAGLAARAEDFDRSVLLWEKEDSRLLSPVDLARPGRTLYVLGPEGGLSPREAELFLDAGMSCTGLGPGILRWETAALVCLGLNWWAKGLPRK